MLTSCVFIASDVFFYLGEDKEERTMPRTTAENVILEILRAGMASGWER
jgi:hypothetical protein